MDCRKIKILQAISRVKELAEKGNISEASSEIFKVDNLLDQKERNAIMKTFTTSIERYNEGINWNDICHS
jgi:hypothetical protein